MHGFTRGLQGQKNGLLALSQEKKGRVEYVQSLDYSDSMMYTSSVAGVTLTSAPLCTSTTSLRGVTCSPSKELNASGLPVNTYRSAFVFFSDRIQASRSSLTDIGSLSCRLTTETQSLFLPADVSWMHATESTKGSSACLDSQDGYVGPSYKGDSTVQGRQQRTLLPVRALGMTVAIGVADSPPTSSTVPVRNSLYSFRT